MDFIPPYARLVENTPLPRVALARQTFPGERVENIPAALKEALAGHAGRISPGMSIAITAGSRGFAGFAPLLREIVRFVAARGAKPFVVPAMGSHGGARAEGQLELLKALGVDGDSLGCPIRSSMETVEIGKLANGMSARMDKRAYEADGIILYNRIKPHSAFRAPLESGLAKMLAIGLGKQAGAEICHMWGFGHMGHLVEEMAALKLAKCKILLGIGTIENAYDQLARIVALEPRTMLEREKELLKTAMRNMPRLPLGPLDEPLASGPLDVLVVDNIGKEFSGAGMDPNITGRPCSPAISGGPAVKRIVALDLTDKSRGNANGLSRADVITDRLLGKVDRNAVYINSLTSGLLCACAIPMNMPDDRRAIQAAVKTCESPRRNEIRLIRIPNTLKLQYIYVSEAMLPELAARPGIEILEDARPMSFDANGMLADPWPA